jgi:hypothetical protein
MQTYSAWFAALKPQPSNEIESSNNDGRKSWHYVLNGTRSTRPQSKTVVDKPLETTLADVIGFLDQHRIRYALIGGLAASLQGEPRVTADVDLVIGAGVEDALGLLNELKESPLEPLFSGVDEVVRKAFILPLRHRLTGVKIDLSLGLSGFERQLIDRATAVELVGRDINLASAEDLLVMKLLAGRPRDQQDAQGIAIVQGEQLDWTYCRTIALELGQAVDQDIATHIEKLREEHGPNA